MQIGGFVFSRRSSFSWLTGGGESGVDEFSEAGVADLVITENKAYVLAPNNEIDLLLKEPLADQGYEPVVYSWSGNRVEAIKALIGNKITGSDLPVPGCQDLYGAVKELRYSLLPEELKRLTELAQTTVALVGQICRAVRPGDSEIKIAGELKGRLGREGIYVPVALVAADERLDQFRHPIPTGKRFKNKVMIVVCARRHGLTAALTRTVYADPVPVEVKERMELVNAINARMIAFTFPGKAVSEIFEDAVEAYAAAGYKGEWEKHHQGGPIGYENREYIASAKCSGMVMENQAFAWNPMILDVKSEETVIAATTHDRPLTYDPEWPYKKYVTGSQTIVLPDIFEL